MSYVRERLGNLSSATLGLIILVAILVSMTFSISIGTVDLPMSDVYQVMINKILNLLHLGGNPDYLHGIDYNIVWTLRAPRVVMAFLIGAALAMAGVVMQATVQNPLADPYILGMSSGASFGATAAIACGLTATAIRVSSNVSVAFFAFIGSFVSSMAVLLLSSAGGRTTSVKLVLSGTIISSIFGAFSNLIITLFADAEDMQTITFWLLGSFGGATWSKMVIPGLAFLICLVYFVTQIRILNVMLTGDETATTLGIDLNRKRRLYVMFCAVLTACAVCFCGVIGFVGLMIPHIVRGLTGNNHWKLLPMSILVGGLFMIWADLAARSILDSGELPIGIITAVCGAPIFAYIMIKKTYSFA